MRSVYGEVPQEQFLADHKAAEKRLQEIKTALFARGYGRNDGTRLMDKIKFDEYGTPEAWINCQGHIVYAPVRRDRKTTAQEAFERAKKFGDTGYWSLEELEQFAKGKGPIIESAMNEQGFIRGKKREWVRARNEEELYKAKDEAHERRFAERTLDGRIFV